MKTAHVRRHFTSWKCFLLYALAAMALPCAPTSARADDWPQWLGPKRDGVWRETGILETFPKGGPKELWRVPIASGYSGPAVADGRVFVTDRPASGKQERVICVDEKTGNVLWQKEYPCTYKIAYPLGPRCSPLVAGDKVYTVGAMGDLLCLAVKDGEILWQKNFMKEYKAPKQMWGFAGHPILDGNRLICLVGGPDSLVVAFDKDSGKEIWKAINVDEAGYAPPMIHEFGGKRQVVVWHPQGLHGLNPENGQVYWHWDYNKPAKVGLVISTPRVDGNKIFVTAFYEGPLMLELDKNGENPKVVWQGKSKSELPEKTDGLHSIMVTPYIQDGHIYGVCSYGELRCLDAANGKRLWMSLKPTTGGQEVRWANAFLTPNADRWFLFNESGDLIIAKMSPQKYEEIGRVNILPPTSGQFNVGRQVLWSHPAYANRHIYARNDKHLVCVSLAQNQQ